MTIIPPSPVAFAIQRPVPHAGPVSRVALVERGVVTELELFGKFADAVKGAARYTKSDGEAMAVVQARDGFSLTGIGTADDRGVVQPFVFDHSEMGGAQTQSFVRAENAKSLAAIVGQNGYASFIDGDSAKIVPIPK